MIEKKETRVKTQFAYTDPKKKLEKKGRLLDRCTVM